MRAPDSWGTARTTMVIVVVTIAAWLFLSLSRLEGWAVENLAFIPARLTFAAGDPAAWLTPLGATLIHAGIVPLAFNLLALFVCGRLVESVVGRSGMAFLYLLGAYAAAGADYALDPFSVTPMLGAAGAISAVIGAYAMLFGRNKVRRGGPRLALWLNALWLLAAWLALQLLLGLGLTLSLAGAPATAAALAAGFLTGALLGYPMLMFRYRKA